MSLTSARCRRGGGGRGVHRRSGSTTAWCARRPAPAASTADAGPPPALKTGLSEGQT